MNLILDKLELNSLDIKLFHFLHAYKVASYEQINRYIYTDYHADSVSKRLRKLQSNKLISIIKYGSVAKKKNLVHLTKLTFKNFIQTGDEYRIELKSDAIEHDLELVDIGERIQSSSKVCSYQSENQVQTWSTANRSINSDAMISLKLKDKVFTVPIEYENVQKSKKRYQTFVKNYYNNQKFNIVLIVANSNGIVNCLKDIEQQNFNWEHPKFFYQLKDKILTNDAITFKNCNDFCLNL